MGGKCNVRLKGELPIKAVEHNGEWISNAEYLKIISQTKTINWKYD